MKGILNFKKKNISMILLLGILIAIIENSTAQTNNTFVPKINIPTSPEAGLIGRFGDIPVGYYTGTANISIPLYTVKEGGIEVPISLNYHSSGIKVEDQATWVGLGWELMPEGSIIQEVRGMSDELENELDCNSDPNYVLFLQRFIGLPANSYDFQTQFGRATASNECMDKYPQEDPYCAIDKLQRGIGEPDIYNYNFGGYSGKFYINPETHQIIIIDKKEQIYFEKTNVDCIKATTMDGTIYTFGSQAVEKAYGGVVGEYTGKTYKLSNITQLNGKEIGFSYSDNAYLERTYNETANVNSFEQTYPISKSYNFTHHTTKTLTQITSSDAIINFNLENREDINIEVGDNVQRLKSIDIISKLTNKKIKSIAFGYSYFPFFNDGSTSNDPMIISNSDALGKRLKLETVKEIGYDNNSVAISTKPPYQFDYDLSVTLPLKTSFAKDFWGYYNGATNTSLLPDLDYFDYFYQSEYLVKNQNLAYPYIGANRYTDNLKAGAYMLKKNHISYRGLYRI